MKKPESGLWQFWESFKGYWRLYRSFWGLLGLGLLSFFLVIGIFADLIAPYDPYKLVGSMMEPPSWQHFFGTDEIGRDIFSRVIYGTRVSLLVGFVASGVCISIGTVVGVLSGYHGGRLDDLLMRMTDVFLVVPAFPLMIILAAILKPNIWNLVLVVSIRGWVATARMVRSSTLSLKTREFVEASKSFGSSSAHIIYRHILPNVMPLVFANAIILVGNAILSEAGLSFLGLGDPLQVSWGTILFYATNIANAVALGAWWYILPPGICIMVVVVAFSFINIAVDPIVNPRLRKR